MSVDILGTRWDRCMSTVQYCFMSTETIRLVRTGSPGWPPWLSHSSWTLIIVTDIYILVKYQSLQLATKPVTKGGNSQCPFFFFWVWTALSRYMDTSVIQTLTAYNPPWCPRSLLGFVGCPALGAALRPAAIPASLVLPQRWSLCRSSWTQRGRSGRHGDWALSPKDSLQSITLHKCYRYFSLWLSAEQFFICMHFSVCFGWTLHSSFLCLNIACIEDKCSHAYTNINASMWYYHNTGLCML